MNHRAATSLIFAGCGVLIVVAVCALNDIGPHPEALTAGGIAAVSAALVGAASGGLFARRSWPLAAILGVLAMGLAHIPFSVGYIAFIALDRLNMIHPMRFLRATLEVVISGWLYAWPLLIAAGALAGLAARYVARRNALA